MRLKGKVAIVTGSGQGIGRAIAIAMAKEGALVMTNNRKPGTAGGDAETTAAEIRNLGGRAAPFYGDISNFAVAQKLIQSALDNFGRVDILVNNAGIDIPNMIWNISEEEWDHVVDCSLKGTFNCIRSCCSVMMQQRWGRILNATSFIWVGTTERAHYEAAKAGVVGLTRAIARELGAYGITCNAYAPVAGTRITTSPEQIARYKRKYEASIYTRQQFESMMNLPSPEMMPPFLIYLCTDEATDINGQVFDVRPREIAIYLEQRTKAIAKPAGPWTVDELKDLVPRALLPGYKNPAPARTTDKP